MNRRFEIFDDPEALARHAAEWLTAAVEESAGSFRVSLAGGSTPRRLYELLSSVEFRGRIPWERVHWYWGDERFVSRQHSNSNYLMVHRALLSKVPVPQRNIHAVPVTGTPDEAARRYELSLHRHYGGVALDPARPFFDVTLLGLGADGHTASLFPGDRALEERRRWIVAVPRVAAEARITMTYSLLESSRRVTFLAAGADKAAMLETLRVGGSRVPAARLQPVGEVLWFVDRAAAGSG